MKRYEGVEVQQYAFITSSLYGGEWSASRPGRFTPIGERKYSHPFRELNPPHPNHGLGTTDWSLVRSASLAKGGTS